MAAKESEKIVLQNWERTINLVLLQTVGQGFCPQGPSVSWRQGQVRWSTERWAGCSPCRPTNPTARDHQPQCLTGEQLKVAFLLYQLYWILWCSPMLRRTLRLCDVSLLSLVAQHWLLPLRTQSQKLLNPVVFWRCFTISSGWKQVSFCEHLLRISTHCLELAFWRTGNEELYKNRTSSKFLLVYCWVLM